MDNYIKLAKIGSGTYGVVYKVRNQKTLEEVAMKRMPIEDEVPEWALREIAALKHLVHPKIVTLKDVVYTPDALRLMFKLYERDLKKYMRLCGKNLHPMLIKSYLYQLLQGVAHIHAHNFIHRDLKPENLLIDKKGNLVIADFGQVVQVVTANMYSLCTCTLWYRPPEILLSDEHYTTAIDMWSVGCIFAEMVTRTPIFPGDSKIDQLFRIFQCRGTPTDTTWPNFSTLPDYATTFPDFKQRNFEDLFPDLDPKGIALLSDMLCCNPRKRISAQAALKHPYFDDLKALHKKRDGLEVSKPDFEL